MQVDQMKREREDKNKIIANLMTQIKVHSPSFSFVFLFFTFFLFYLFFSYFKINYSHKFIKGLTPEASKSKYLFTSPNLAPLFLFLFFLFCLFLNLFFPAVTSPNQPTKHKHSIRTHLFGPSKKKNEDPKLDSAIASMYVTEETQKLKASVDTLEATNSDLLVKISTLSHGILSE